MRRTPATLLTTLTIAALAGCTPPPADPTPTPTVTVTQTLEAPAPAVTVTRKTTYTSEDGNTALSVLDPWESGTLGTGTYLVHPTDNEGTDQSVGTVATRLYELTPNDPTATSDPTADPRDREGWWFAVQVFETQAAREDEQHNNSGYLLAAACQMDAADWTGTETPNDTVTIQWCPGNNADVDGTFISASIAAGAVSIDCSTSVDDAPGSPAANAAYAALRTLAVTVLSERATQVNNALPAS